MDTTILARDGRSIGVHDFGPAGATPVLWCHGGPGSRLEPGFHASDAAAAGLRLVGVDRPGYGLSTPRPGRTIRDGVEDLFVVADALGVTSVMTVGVSTGGAYALAAAAIAPDRVLGVVACCAVTDMRWEPARRRMSPVHAHAVWDAPDRDAAIAAAREAHGEDGHKLLNMGLAPVLAPSDLALFNDPAWMSRAMADFPAMFTFGAIGYADDRIADGPGWDDFDVEKITCRVIVLHGGRDLIADVVNAVHTAALVPGAELVVLPEEGHFSIERHVVAALARMRPGR